MLSSTVSQTQEQEPCGSSHSIDYEVTALCELADGSLVSASNKLVLSPRRPLHFGFCLGLDLSKRGDSFARFTSLTKPKLEFCQRAIVALLSASQIASFCVTPLTAPHIPKELHGAFVFAKDLGFTHLSMNISFEHVYYTTVGFVVGFLITMLGHAALETAAFLRPESKSLKYGWLLAKTYLELFSTLFFVSVFRTLLRGLDCTYVHDEAGRLMSLDALATTHAVFGGSGSGSAADATSTVVGLECWQWEHASRYAIPSALSLAAFGSLSFRLLLAGSDLSALELEATRPLDCRRDGKKAQPRVHPLSLASPSFGTATVVTKMTVASAEVLLTHYPVVYAVAMLVTTTALVAVVWVRAPYHDSLPNRCQLGLQIAVLCCACAQFVVTVWAPPTA